MIFSKLIKLITHFIRYPVDIIFWPVSVLFGWFHGAIKVYAMVTLSEVSDTILCTLSAANQSLRQHGEAVLAQMQTTMTE